jgi:hypothetical protein
MSRTYTDPIEVRRAPSAPQVGLPVHEQPPTQFLWRGRLYVVRAVVAHWIESAAWWGGSRRALEGGIPAHEHEIWRVEAQAGRSAATGVYDLRRDLTADRWVLARALD